MKDDKSNSNELVASSNVGAIFILLSPNLTTTVSFLYSAPVNASVTLNNLFVAVGSIEGTFTLIV